MNLTHAGTVSKVSIKETSETREGAYKGFALHGLCSELTRLCVREGRGGGRGGSSLVELDTFCMSYSEQLFPGHCLCDCVPDNCRNIKSDAS